MNNIVLDFAVDYFKNKTSRRKVVKNQELDAIIQENLGTNPLHESGVRSLIHYIRLNVNFENEEGEKGWICGMSDGYYLSYNAMEILSHLESFEGKIQKMMKIHQKGMSILVNKIYYKQQKLKFSEND
jgi:hypothetical protein